MSRISRTPHNCPVLPMKRPRVAALWCWRKKSMAVVGAKSANIRPSSAPVLPPRRAHERSELRRPGHPKGGAGNRSGSTSPNSAACSRKRISDIADGISRTGGTPLVVSDNEKVLGVIHLKDIVKGGMRERFAQMRVMGIRTVMITGDNPLTAAAIASEAGVDDFLAQATPRDKLDLIKREQAGSVPSGRHDG